MLEERYKIKQDRLQFSPPFFGYALCCGAQPKVDFDSLTPNYFYRIGHIGCPVCNKQVGVISNAGTEFDRVGFLYHHWNRANKGAPLFGVPEGFKPYDCYLETLYLGGKKEIHFNFIFIKIEDKYLEYKPLRGKHRILDLPTGKGGFVFRTNTWSSTDGSKWDGLYLTTSNHKWEKKARAFLGIKD